MQIFQHLTLIYIKTAAKAVNMLKLPYGYLLSDEISLQRFCIAKRRYSLFYAAVGKKTQGIIYVKISCKAAF